MLGNILNTLDIFNRLLPTHYQLILYVTNDVKGKGNADEKLQ